MNANPNNDPPVEYPWKRRRSQRPKTDPVDHYEDESFNYYGYNKKKIQFPLYRNDGMAQKLHDQLTNNFIYLILFYLLLVIIVTSEQYTTKISGSPTVKI